MHLQNLTILATINLVNTIGLGTVKNKLKIVRMDKVPDDMSISLGNLSASPLQMSKMYSIFSNGGNIVEPVLVSKIIDREGKVVFVEPNKTVAILPPQLKHI